jgi:hypothetical protein
MAAPSGGAQVAESAREIPVAYKVDVLVVGGTTGAVSAACEAARNGATVFLAAPRTYLGEDVCGTLRLWLTPGERPTTALAKALYRPPAPGGRPLPAGLPFSYTASRASAGRHRDKRPPSMLCDGRAASAVSQSVEYGGDVSLTVDLSRRRAVRKVHLYVYQRRGDFAVAGVAVHASEDGRTWRRLGAVRNDRLGGADAETAAIDLAVGAEAAARYVRLDVKQAPRARRVLLGEIVVEGAGGEAPHEKPARRPPTPMHVKRTLDRALLEAGVRFLFGCYATDILRDAKGNVAGIVMANRAGRQAVVAKVVIDATPRATVARLAGARGRPFPAGPREFTRVVVAAGPPDEAAREVPVSVGAKSRPARAAEHALTIDMPDGSFESFAAAEQIARDKTWRADTLDASDVLWYVPPDSLKAAEPLEGDWPGPAKAPLGAFRPAGVERVYVLGGCADVPRTAAAKLLRPPALMALGERMGAAAATEAKKLGEPAGVRVSAPAAPGEPAAEGDVGEALEGLSFGGSSGSVGSAARGVEVLGEYDVAVVGGGTSGAPAGIAAARSGAKTLVLEYLHGLGGVGTMGLIGRYYHGYRKGFTAEVDRGVKRLRAEVDVVGKAEWWRRELRKAGAEVWFGVLGCGALVEDGRVRGVVVATPHGRGVVRAKTVIDATGNADVAAAAGAECEHVDAAHVAMQGTGLPPQALGASYTNTDYTFVTDHAALDVWRAFVSARAKFPAAYDVAPIVDSRERRRIVGDFVLSPMDQINGRTYPDTVMIARSDFDSHGFTVHPLFFLDPPDKRLITCHVPYRCLLPKGLEGLLATGLGVSAHRDAIPIIRMQPCVQNQGYAAGVAAAMAAKLDGRTRKIDVKALQRHLVEVGCLPDRVLTDTDSFPLPTDQVAKAVRAVPDDWRGLPVVLAQPEQSLPLLREAHASAEGTGARLAYAEALAMLGDGAGAETLAEAVRAAKWDRGWNFRGMGQYGGSTSRVDGLVIALGRTRDPRALPALAEKAAALLRGKRRPAFSHCRAVALAAETLGNAGLAKPLAALLARDGMTGHALSRDETASALAAGRDPLKGHERNAALREIVLARALFRCGDQDGLARRVLEAYRQDVRGLFARHADAVLRERRAD